MAPKEPRAWIARGYTLVEDVIYVGLGLLLSVLVVALLVVSSIELGESLIAWSLPGSVVPVLDRILLVLLIVELLYTVQVSFRAHRIEPEPFLLVGLISAIRRVLVLAASFGEKHEQHTTVTTNEILELGVLAGLILVLAMSLMLLRRSGATAERS